VTRILIIGFFLLGIGAELLAQETIAPQLLCATTDINGDVTLTWGESAETCGPFVEYNVFAATDIAGPYTLIGTVTDVLTTTYTHIGADGAVTTWYYYIEAVYDCAGYTMTLTDTLDNLDPVAPELVNVTVVTGGQVQVNWEVSPSPETTAYIIYRDIGGFTPIDTVYGRFTTTTTDATAVPAEQVETYTIAAMDSCGNIGPFNNNSHHTILLTVNWLVCTDTIELFWNEYDTWDDGVNRYEVWLDDDGSGAVLYDVLPPGSTSYAYSGPEFADGLIFAFYVRAVKLDESTFSNSSTRGFQVFNNQPSDFNVIRNASVNINNTIDVEWYPDVNADVNQFTISRSDDNISFLNIGNTDFPGGIPTIYTFTDNGVQPDDNIYYYRATVSDACDVSLTSGIARTIRLTGIANADFTNDISWNAFEIENGTVTGYSVFRNDGTTEVLVANTLPDERNVTDDVSAFLEQVESFCYRIEAQFDLEVEEISVSESLLTYSNILCLQQGPRIYVPNAIAPNGLNNEFKPYIVFGTEEGYLMQIFDRYGSLIFESNDLDQGWKGTIDGNEAPLGTYGYLITFTASNGQVITKKGNITVIR
jgi:gliding motility-associated-like protein